MLQERFPSAAAVAWAGLCALTFCTLPTLPAAPCLGQDPAPGSSGQENLGETLNVAIGAEAQLELTRAASLYAEIVRQCGRSGPSEVAIAAQQGLRRVASLRAGFAWTHADLDRALAKAFSGYQSEELPQWEGRGWLYARTVDGQKRYHVSGATNLAFFDTALRRRNPRLAEGDRFFARVFLEAAADLDARRRSPGPPQPHVLAQTYLYTVKVSLRQMDLPPGETVRAWIPAPLEAPAVQNVRVTQVQPPGALILGPDVQATLGVVSLEVPRPRHGDLTLSLSIAFDTCHTDLAVDPRRIPPYDERSEVFRRFTRDEPQIALSPAMRALARSIVGEEENPYHKARRLYDWVCEHCTYNYVWHQRDATFTWGCASEEVLRRRVGDCVTQSMFYAALCRSVGLPARILNGPVFPPCFKNDHVWAEVLFPGWGWFPVDVTYSEVVAMAPDLSEMQRRQLRDFFFGRLDRWRFCSQRGELAQPLVPPKNSPRKRATMFTHPEFECGGQDVERAAVTWDCRAQADSSNSSR